MTATLRVESHLDTTLRSSDATAARMRVDMATTPPRGGGCRRTTLISGAKTSKAAREATDHIRRDRALEGTRMVLAWSVGTASRAHAFFRNVYYLRLLEDYQWCELGVNVFSE